MKNLLKNIFNSKIYRNILIIFFIIVIFSCLLTIFTFGLGIHSYDQADYLEGILWAKATIDSGKLLSTTFVYPYVVTVGANILLIPFIKLFGYSLLSNQLSMLVFFIIYLFTLYKLSCSLFDNINKKLLFVSVSLLFVYTYAGENILHHILFYGISYVCLIGCLSCVINIKKGTSTKKDYILLVIYLLWACTNGIVCAVLCGGVTCASLVLLSLYKNGINKTIKNHNLIKLIIFILFFIIIGLLIHKILITDVIQREGISSRLNFDTLENILKNIYHDIVFAYTDLFYIFPSGIKMLSVRGIGIVVEIVFAVVLLISTIISIIYFKRYEDTYKFVLINSYIVMLICIAEFVLMNANSERYLFNGLFMMFIIMAININEIENINIKTISIIFVLLLAIGLSFKCVYTFINNKKEINDKKEIIKVLKDNNLEYGIAKYSNVIYVLSESDIKTLPSTIIKNNFYKHYYNVEQEDYYSLPKNEDDFFVLLSDIELEQLNTESLALFENAKETIKFNEYNIYIFDNKYWNIFDYK